MKVIFLGTGNAFASGGRFASAVLLRDHDFGVLLDCGPTTLVALKRQGLAPADVDVVLVSHHHGDHFGGVPFLVLHECFDGSRSKSLHVLGPPGTIAKMGDATRLFFPGIEPVPYPLEYRDLEPGEELRLGKLRAAAFEVDHYSRGSAFGYRVTLSGKTIVFSGDTAWTDELTRQSAGADLFICECSSFDTSLERHMSHRDLVSHADELEAKRTVLVHAGEDVLAHEPELIFELAYDGMEVTL